MIPIVDVTGTYIFGFGSRSAAIGSLTRMMSPLQSLKIITYSIATSNRITSIKSPKNITTFVRFSTQLRFEHSFIKTAKLSSSYTIAASDKFTTVKPVTIFANDAVKNVYKYAGLRTPKLFTILRDIKLRFDGDIGSIIYSPKIGNIRYTSLNTSLDKIAFSFCDPGEVLSVKFYRDTELFKTSTITALSPSTIEKGFRDVFGGTSAIIPPVIFAIKDSNYTTIFNYGSGMNTSYLANILTKLSVDYTNTPFTGMRITKIYSALPLGWKQYQQPTKILIQFWS